jgi:thiol-disulfide isomerase/thioredoxin
MILLPQIFSSLLTAKRHEISREKKREKHFVSFRVLSPLNLFGIFATLSCFIFVSAENSFAQTRKAKTKIAAKKTKIAPKKAALDLPKVTQIDAEALKNLLKPNGKPLLVNFWATWCDPCREEFPDLVKIGADYKDKIDLITISLDELSEINGDVPKFLAEMKSNSPAYLLKTPDEAAAIAIISKDWQGGLPFTILLMRQAKPFTSNRENSKPSFCEPKSKG